jgi:uncharacterized protein
MVVGVAVCELHISQARSLKDKRRVIKGLVERIHQRFRVSIAETDFHDLHQRAEIGVAVVTQHERDAEQILETVYQMIEAEPASFVAKWDPQILEMSE